MKITRNTQGTIAGIARSPRYNQNMMKHVSEEDKGVVDDNSNHRRSTMVFLTMNSIVISMEVKMLMLITTHLSKGSMKMTSRSDAIKQQEG